MCEVWSQACWSAVMLVACVDNHVGVKVVGVMVDNNSSCSLLLQV